MNSVRAVSVAVAVAGATVGIGIAYSVEGIPYVPELVRLSVLVGAIWAGAQLIRAATQAGPKGETPPRAEP